MLGHRVQPPTKTNLNLKYIEGGVKPFLTSHVQNVGPQTLIPQQINFKIEGKWGGFKPCQTSSFQNQNQCKVEIKGGRVQTLPPFQTKSVYILLKWWRVQTLPHLFISNHISLNFNKMGEGSNPTTHLHVKPNQFKV